MIETGLPLVYKQPTFSLQGTYLAYCKLV